MNRGGLNVFVQKLQARLHTLVISMYSRLNLFISGLLPWYCVSRQARVDVGIDPYKTHENILSRRRGGCPIRPPENVKCAERHRGRSLQNGNSCAERHRGRSLQNGNSNARNATGGVLY